jgi:hypothetical protein
LTDNTTVDNGNTDNTTVDNGNTNNGNTGAVAKIWLLYKTSEK